MKRFLASILSTVVATSVLLCGCAKDSSELENNKNNNSDRKYSEENYVLVSNGIFDVKANENYGDKMSFNEAATRLEEIQPMSENDKEFLLTAGGVEISATAARYANIACNDYYLSSGLSVEDNAEAILNEIESFYKLNTAVHLLTCEFKVGISDQDFDDISLSIDQFKEAYQDEYDTVFETYAYQTPYYYFYSQLYNIAYANLHDFIYGENGDQNLVNQIYDQTVQQLKDSDKIRAKHILISFPEDIEKDDKGNIPESAKAQTLEKANEVLSKVNAGEDFDTLMAQYSQDPGTQAYPDGYIFGKGEMVQEFEDASYTLEEGKTSGLVETTYGYHIIQRLPLEHKASILASDQYLELSYEDFSEKLSEVADGIKIVYGDEYDEKVEKFLADYMTEKEAQTSEQTESEE